MDKNVYIEKLKELKNNLEIKIDEFLKETSTFHSVIIDVDYVKTNAMNLLDKILKEITYITREKSEFDKKAERFNEAIDNFSSVVDFIINPSGGLIDKEDSKQQEFLNDINKGISNLENVISKIKTEKWEWNNIFNNSYFSQKEENERRYLEQKEENERRYLEQRERNRNRFNQNQRKIDENLKFKMFDEYGNVTEEFYIIQMINNVILNIMNKPEKTKIDYQKISRFQNLVNKIMNDEY